MMSRTAFRLSNFILMMRENQITTTTMEIKFFDRLKALEKLEEITDQGQTDTLPFYEALENSAKLLQKRAGEDEA